MKHDEQTLLGFEGRELFYQSWEPEGAPKATIAIVHGGAEHSGHYEFFVDYFLAKGFALAGLDLRGHGRSKGKRGHVMDWNEIRQDLSCYLSRVRKELPGTHVFLFGHSMGGTASLDYSLRHLPAVSGVILSGAGIAPQKASPVLIAIAKVVSLLWPSLSLKTGLDFTVVSRDPAVVQSYLDDPLVLSRVSARFGIEFMRTIQSVNDHASDWKLPVLMLYGSDDGFASVEEINRFFAKLGGDDKKLIIYEGGYHQPHSDLQKQQVFSDIEKWIDARISA